MAYLFLLFGPNICVIICSILSKTMGCENLVKEYYLKKAKCMLRYNDFPGDEPAILFLHGIGCAGSFDYPQVAAQEELRNHRCILIDLLGAG